MVEAVVRESPVTEPELEQRFHLFVEAYRERARRLAWRLVGGDDTAADDVTQEAFVKAYRALGRFREEASLATAGDDSPSCYEGFAGGSTWSQGRLGLAQKAPDSIQPLVSLSGGMEKTALSWGCPVEIVYI